MTTSTLYHGDCLEVMASLPDKSVDAIITDPPYGTTACKWDSVIPFAPMWAELKRIIKPRGAIVLFGSQPFTSALVMSNPKMFRYEWVWRKSHASNFLNAKRRPMLKHESLLVFYRQQPTYNPQMIIGRPKPSRVGKPTGKIGKQGVYGSLPTLERVWSDLYYPTTDLYVPCGRRADSKHSTQKPVALMSYLIRTYTNPGDTVLDFTMGSGSTGVACMETGHNFIGIERDAHYFQVAQQRIAAASLQVSA